MEEKRVDMSKTCGMHYHDYWNQCHTQHTMTQEQLNDYIAKNCGKCCYMSDICMYGEGEDCADTKEDD